MSRLIIAIALAFAFASPAVAQWEGYQPQRGNHSGQIYSTSTPVIYRQPGSYLLQESDELSVIQDDQNGQGTPGQTDFFDQDQNQEIDHEQELREHQEFTGFDMTDAEISDHGIADRQGGQPGAGPGGAKGDGPGGDMGDMATQSNNPVGGLWMLWNQNDMTLYEGPAGGKRIFNTTVFQPVLPIQLNETWRVINRPVFTLQNFETPVPNFNYNPGGSFPAVPPSDPFRNMGGLGDTMFIQWFSKSPEDSKIVFGAGLDWMFPTATDKDLGTGKWAAGPSIVALYLGDKVITGAVMQQYWSFAGDASRDRVSYMDTQVIYRYRLNPMFSIGGSPNIKWDQVTGKWTVPIGLGFDSMTMWQGKPARFGAELQYYVSHTGGSSPTSRAFDPEWTFRLYFSPIIQAPEWAKKGILGKKKCRRGCHCRKCCR